MKAVRVLLVGLSLVVSVIGLLSSACTKSPGTTVMYDTVYVMPSPDTGKHDIIVVAWFRNGCAKSDCDLFVNGDFAGTIFRTQFLDTLIVPEGARVKARWIDITPGQLMTVDTVVNVDTLVWRLGG